MSRARLPASPVRARAYERARAVLARRGATVLLAARFVPAGRTAATLAAGATGYPLRPFLAVTAVGAPLGAAWTALLGFLGGASARRRRWACWWGRSAGRWPVSAGASTPAQG